MTTPEQTLAQAVMEFKKAVDEFSSSVTKLHEMWQSSQAPAEDPIEWREWRGGFSPIDNPTTKVHVKLKDGSTMVLPAGGVQWRHYPKDPNPVVAWAPA